MTMEYLENYNLKEDKKPQPISDPIRRQFWCNVFLRVCEPSDFHNASIRADIALEEYDKQFNKKESK